MWSVIYGELISGEPRLSALNWFWKVTDSQSLRQVCNAWTSLSFSGLLALKAVHSDWVKSWMRILLCTEQIFYLASEFPRTGPWSSKKYVKYVAFPLESFGAEDKLHEILHWRWDSTCSPLTHVLIRPLGEACSTDSTVHSSIFSYWWEGCSHLSFTFYENFPILHKINSHSGDVLSCLSHISLNILGNICLSSFCCPSEIASLLSQCFEALYEITDRDRSEKSW